MVVSNLMVAMLVDRGLIEYDERIKTYWPEFMNSDDDKGKVTIENLLRHEAGLFRIPKVIDPEDLLTKAIKRNRMGSIIE